MLETARISFIKYLQKEPHWIHNIHFYKHIKLRKDHKYKIELNGVVPNAIINFINKLNKAGIVFLWDIKYHRKIYRMFIFVKTKEEQTLAKLLYNNKQYSKQEMIDGSIALGISMFHIKEIYESFDPFGDRYLRLRQELIAEGIIDLNE